MAFLNNTFYTVLSGNGAVQQKMLYHVPMQVAPQKRQIIRYKNDPIKRYEQYLLRKYNNNPTGFYYDYYRFIVKYKAFWYISIYDRLMAIFLLRNKNKERVTAVSRKRVYPSNRYTMLKIQNNYSKTELEEPEILFHKRDYVKEAQIICKNAHIATLERNQLVALCKQSYNISKGKPMQRNIILLRKLKLVILKLYNNRCGKNITYAQYIIDKYYQNRVIYKRDNIVRQAIVQPQSDIRSEDPQLREVEQAVNTILSSEVVNTPDYQPEEQHWTEFCAGDTMVNAEKLTDRWIRIDSLKWSKDKTMGNIKQYNLPGALLKQDTANIPNFALFRLMTQFTYDSIDIKVQQSGSPFDKGALLVSYQYGANLSFQQNLYDATALRTQRGSAILIASDSSSVKLRIPYNYPLPMMRVRKLSQIEQLLNQVVLYIDVLSPLRQVESAPIDIQVYMMFNNLRFIGPVHAGIAQLEPQMFRNFTTNIEKLLHWYNKPPNTDKPINSLAPPYVVNTGFHSWAYGTGTDDPLHGLRLDARAQTPHPGIMNDVPFTVKAICERKGLLNIITITKDQPLGRQVYCIDACPVPRSVDLLRMASRTADRLTLYNMPPISVVSSLFAYWRGSILITGKIISTVKERCKLRLCYIPGVSCVTDVTYEQALTSPHAIISIPEQLDFEFSVPYINDHPWYNRKYSGNYVYSEVVGPSSFRIYIENALTPMTGLISQVDILLYMSAGSDFEVAVPVQPAICLSSHAYEADEKGLFIITAGNYAPYYAGTWHSFLDGEYFIMRHAATSDAVTPFQSIPAYNQGYYLEIENITLAPTVHVIQNTINEQIAYGILLPNTDGYVYLIPVRSPGGVQRMAAYFRKKGVIDFNTLPDYMKTYLYNAKQYDQHQSKYSHGNPRWIVRIAAYQSNEIADDFEIIAQSDEIIPCVTLKSTGNGMITFGESYNELKDICRRYCPYTHINYTVPATADHNRVFVSIPLYWQCLNGHLHMDHARQRTRDSIPAILLSAYAGIRGGLRVRIAYRVQGNNLFVQHRPDRAMNHDAPVLITEARNADAFMNQGYATYVQSDYIDQIEFEIPWYQPNVWNYNHLSNSDPTIKSMIGLGYLYIGCVHPVDIPMKVSISVYTAFADDTAPYIWRGFPAMSLLDEIPEILPLKTQIMEPQGPVEWITSKVKATTDEVVAEATTEIGQKVTASLTEAMADFGVDRSAIVIPLISNFVHAIVNPNIKTYVISLISILGQIGVVTMALMQKAITVFEKFIKRIFSSEQSPAKPATGETVIVEPQGEEDQAAASVIALLYSGIASLCSFTAKAAPNVSKFKRFLMADLGNVTRNANSLFVFTRNVFSTIKQLFYNLIGQMIPEWSLIKQLEDNSEIVQCWAEMSLALLDPQYKRDNMEKYWYADKIDSAWVEGSVIIARITGEALRSRPLQALIKIFDNITKVREELVAMGKHPSVRKEPMVIWVAGPPKIGKSFATDAICTHLLNAVQYECKGQLKCVVNPASQYMDMCTGKEPVLYVDDFMCIETPNAVESQVQILFSAKTSAPFIPPMAALEDKKMRYSPEIVYINSNRAFINVAGVIHEAIHRRRDALINVRLAEKAVRQECPHCVALNEGKTYDLSIIDPQYLRDFHHLQFAFAADVIDANTTWSEWYSYQDFILLLERKYLRFYESEAAKFKSRVNFITQLADQGTEAMEADITTEIGQIKMKLINEMRSRNESIWCNIKDYALNDTRLGRKLRDKFMPPEKEYIVEVQADDYEIPDWFNNSISNLLTHKKISSKVVNYFTGLIRKHGATPATRYFWGSIEQQLIRSGDTLDSWYVLANILTKMHQPNCRHLGADLVGREYTVAVNTIVKCNSVISLQRCPTTCALSDPFFEEIFYRILYETNLVLKKLVNNKLWDILPEFYRQQTYEKISFTGWLDDVKKFVRNWLLRPLNNTAKMLWKFICDTWPIWSTCGAVMGLVAFANSYDKPEDIARCEERAQLIRDLRAETDNDFTEYQNASRYGETSKGRKKIAAKPQITQAQSENTENIAHIVQNNIAYIRMQSKCGVKHARVIMLGGRKCIIIRHYFEEWRIMDEEKTIWSFVKRQTDHDGVRIYPMKLMYKWLYNTKDETSNSNLGIMLLPSHIPQYRHIAKYMASSDDHIKHGGEITVCDGETMCMMRGVYDPHVKYQIPQDDIVTEVVMTRCIRYMKQSRGMCGSVILSNNLHRPIIGIHVAGMPGVGYGIAEVLYRETFQKVLTIDDISKATPVEKLSLSCDANMEVMQGVIQEGTLGAESAIHQPTTSKIRKSLLHGIFPVRTEPNPLSPYDTRLPEIVHPLASGIEKHANPCKEFNEVEVKLVAAHFGAKLLSYVRPCRGQVGRVGHQIAVCGDAQMAGYTAMDFSTSSGWPLVKLKRPGKKWLFDLYDGVSGYVLQGLNPLLVHYIETDQNYRKQGICAPTVFVDCLKDTCLPIEKCSIPGKTRVFSVSPVQYSVVFRDYFLDFMVAFQSARFSIHHAIGININSIEWTDLLKLLLVKNDKFICGDYSNFGPQLSTQLVEAIIPYILNWYDTYGEHTEDFEEDQKVRKCLLHELVNPYHVGHDLMYRVATGIPSGSPITAPLNSMVNVMYILLAWIELEGSLESIDEKMTLITYGDDLIMSVIPELQDKINTQTLSDYFAQYNIKFTDADKTGVSVLYRTVQDASFLKCKFRPHDTRGPDYMLAQLDIVSIEGTINWIKGTGIKDLHEATQLNVESACRCMFGHGKRAYTAFCTYLRRESYLRGIILKLPDWHELDNLWWSGELFF